MEEFFHEIEDVKSVKLVHYKYEQLKLIIKASCCVRFKEKLVNGKNGKFGSISLYVTHENSMVALKSILFEIFIDS